MQKYIQRSIKAIIFPIFLCSAHASDIPKDAMKVNPQAEIKIDKTFFDNLQMATQKSALKYGQFNEHNMTEIFQKTGNQNDIKREHAYMYMYSTSMPLVTLQNLIPQIKKMKSLEPNTTFYLVLNGFPKASFWKELKTLYKEENKNLFSVKIHPKIYETYRLTNVPAWIKVDCPKDFKFKDCDTEHSFLAKGDISFYDFYELLVKQDSSYLQTYHKLIKAN